MWQEIHLADQDRRLLKAFIGVGLATMSIGGIFALLMLLVRAPAISLLPSGIYYQALTGHGMMMFIFWLGFIQTTFLMVAGTILIRRRLWSYLLGWFGFGTMSAAALLALIGVLSGANITYHASIPLTRQYPMAWLIYLSAILLAAGMLMIVIDFIMTVLQAVPKKSSFRAWAAFFKEIPVASFAAIAGLFVVLPGLVAAIKVFSFAFLWSLGSGAIEPGAFRMNWHIVFHIYHYIPALTLVGVAYVLVEATAKAKSVYASQIAKGLFLLYPLFVPPTFIYHLLMDPNLSYSIKFMGTSLSLLVGVPTILHMFIILGMLEARMRQAGHGFFGWVRHLPWNNPAFASMIVGIVTLFVGGLLSYALIQEQLAPLLHNTFVVPAYIHPMAAGGANIMYMGALYYGLPVLVNKRLWGLRLAKVQPYLMGGALLLMSFFGTVAGLAGIPRRYAQVTPAADVRSVWLNLSLGLGGMLAIVAGVIFVLIMAVTAIAGKKAANPEEAIKGMEAPDLPSKVAYKRTPVALMPSLLFIAGIVVITVLAFEFFWKMPLQMR